MHKTLQGGKQHIGYFDKCLSDHKYNNFDVDTYLGHDNEPLVSQCELYKSKYGKYFCNQNYFHIIDNEWKAYWLGFLYADGCVILEDKCHKSKNVLNINLCRQDKKHLELFKDSLQSDYPIRDYVTKLNNKTFESSSININNKQICDDLVRLGCVPKKSLILQFPSNNQISSKYIRDFIRGYFDGDGCICINAEKKFASFSLNGTKNVLESIRNIFEEQLNLPRVVIRHCSGRNKCYVLSYGNILSVHLIYKYLYQNSNIFLQRKLDKFNTVFSLA